MKVTNNNKLTDENIAHILESYESREDREYVSKLVLNSDVAERDYNLSVSSYVEQENNEEVVDIDSLNNELKEIVAHEDELRKQIDEIICSIEGKLNG